jgi:heme-degrading monooxygenase HmoA
MPGCMHVELLKEVKEGQIYFTRSIWHHENDLNNYRNSELFKGVWTDTKALFDAKPEAWTTELIAEEKGNGI